MNPPTLLALASLVLLAGCFEDVAAEPDAPGPDAPTVRLATVGGTGAGEVRRFVGRVEAASTVDLAFQLAGQVTDLPVREGAVLAAGAPIAALDPADFELAVARAEASLALARAEYDRARDLVERGATPEARRDQAVADLRLAEVGLESARRDLELTSIAAPFDALVTRRVTDRFAYVTPGEPVVRVHDITELRVRISVPEDLIGLARSPKSFAAAARIAALPDFEAPLALSEFVAEADGVTQTYEVSFAIDAPRDERVLPGMTATVEIRSTGGPDGGATAVPLAAVDPNGTDGFQVWVFDAESATVAPRAVTLGLPDAGRVPVLDGIAPGERIVAAGVQHLTPGLKVRPLEL